MTRFPGSSRSSPTSGFVGPAKPDAPIITEPARRQITIRDLATHTSGLNGLLLDIPPDVHQPGTRWAYSSVTGPDILARIVEITSGLPFDRYLKERIFEPIGMRDSGFNLTREQRTRVVPRYAHDATGWHRVSDDTELADPLLPRTRYENPTATYFSGSFGLFSAASDYLQFETMLGFSSERARARCAQRGKRQRSHARR